MVVSRGKQDALEKEWRRLLLDEKIFLDEHKKEKKSRLNAQVEKVMPEQMQQTLEEAFVKAFQLVFEKGTQLIEKTYGKNQAMPPARQKERMLHFRKKAEKSKAVHMAVSAVEGTVLGALGIGVPDIPLFTAVLLRNVYETASGYGYTSDSSQEKIYILRLIETAMTRGESIRQMDEKINTFFEEEQQLSLEEQIEKTAKTLSEQLLYMKFLQSIPIVGAVGGAVDVLCMQQVSSYAQLKYHRRFLVDTMDTTEVGE